MREQGKVFGFKREYTTALTVFNGETEFQWTMSFSQMFNVQADY